MMKRGRERERERAGRRENNPVKDIFRMSEKGYLTYEEGKIPMTQILKKNRKRQTIICLKNSSLTFQTL